MSRRKAKFLFNIILIIIPFLFFILLEFSLRIFDYGIDNSTWIKINNTHYGLNPKVASRYFNNVKNIPEPIQDVFAINKKPDTYRIFLLGGSSAAGFPYMPLGSFSRYIRQRLEQNYPEINIEVVNLGLSAVNSYTILDLIIDVLEQEPDLILIYAGHNEFYGALGVASMESFGRSRSIVNLIIELNKYKVTQLVRNIIGGIMSIFSVTSNSPSGTLMSRMAENKTIEIDSEIYWQGLEQFEENMTDILKLVKDKKVPVIISTIVSNLKDQMPFNSNANTGANRVYSQARKEINFNNLTAADSLFRLAKDLDQIRFRAPEKINEIIKKLGEQFNVPILESEKVLNQISPCHIIGDNLVIDHLHLSLKGNYELGNLFYNKISELKLLPNIESKFNLSDQDSLTRVNFKFSDLDSTIADYQIKLLKNDWPFINPKNKKEKTEIIKLKNQIDSTALDFIQGNETWEKSHRILANRYIKNGDFEIGKKYYDVLIHQYPLTIEYYQYISEQLISKNKFNEAIDYLTNGNKIKSNAYFTKWLGIINLSMGRIDSAINYLEKSMKFSANDPQVLYNLSGAYVNKKNYRLALEVLEKCLVINPNYTEAKNLKVQLLQAIK
ncbi:MAG: tetratricopeptide repeat protein [Ignavibacteriales bacterium]|nr:tetratricopeptide repeat protein [Ignavibacteriales bacterium]MCB9257894.1 tetratricopeptide repeat protein [Ignavibacteriales bacterium]